VKRLRGTIASLVLTVAACATTLPGTPLAIDTAEFQVLPGSCAGVGLSAFRIERDGDTLRFIDVGTETEIRLIWPHGFAARLENGAAVLYASGGAIVGREHDVLEDVGACPRSDGSIRVESIGKRTGR
jgi:hypothetical protein